MPGPNAALRTPTPDVQAAATPHPDAIRVRDFIDNAHAAGYGDVDPNITAALAQGPIAHPIMDQMFGTITQALSQAPKELDHVFSDPGLTSAPTIAQKVGWHIHNTGLPAIASPQLTMAQRNIQSHGYGTNLPLDGTWNNNWTQAMHQMNVDNRDKPGVGNTGAKSTISQVVDAMFPSHSIPFLGSIISSTLDSTYKMLADAAQAGTDIVTGQIVNNTPGVPTLGEHVAAAILSWERASRGGPKISAHDYMTGYDGTKDFIDALGTVATIWSLASGVGETGAATASALTAAKTAGATNIGKALVTDLGKDYATPRLTLLNTLLPKLEEGGRRVAFTRNLDNMPVRQAMYKLTNKTATKVGDAWQTTRIKLATPYRLPVTNIIGGAAQATALTSLKATGIAEGEKALNDSNAPQAYALDHLKPIAGPLGLTMDLLSATAHSLYNPVGKASTNIGHTVEGARKLIAGLDQSYVIGAWARGTNSDYLKIIDEAAKEGIPAAAVHARILDNVDRFAANHFAQGEIEKLPILEQSALSSAKRQTYMENLSSQVRADPKLMTQARTSYLLKLGLLEKDFANSTLHMFENPKLDYQHSFIDSLKMDELMRNTVIPHAEYLVTPETLSTHRVFGGDGKFPATSSLPGLNKDMPLTHLGYMRLDKQSSADAQNKATELYDKFIAARPDEADQIIRYEPGMDVTGPNGKIDRPDLAKNFDLATATKTELQIRLDAEHYLAQELGVNTKNLRYLTTPNLIQQIERASHNLAGLVTVPFDAPLALRQAEKEAEALGYRLAYGTDIGHAFTNPNLPLNELGQAQSRVSKMLDKIGINFTQVDPAVIGAHSNALALTHLQKQLNDRERYPFGSLPVWGTATNIVNHIRSVESKQMNTIMASIMGASNKRILSPIKGGRWNAPIKKIMDDSIKVGNDGVLRPQKTREAAIAELKDGLTKTPSPTEWTKPQVIQALTQPLDDGTQMMTPEIATKIYNDLQTGLRKTPARLQGLEPFTKLLESSFFIAGRKIPFTAYQLPNFVGDARRTLISFRYQASPEFALKRVIKVGLKGMSEGIPFAGNAEDSMKAAGTYTKDMALRDKYLPHEAAKNSFMNDVTREFGAADIVNVYDPKAIQARIIGFLHRDALRAAGGDASQIDAAALVKKFDKIYSYGNRTAAEKTVNAIWFPFSFEKTVMRQLGGHLLDHPGERLMVAAAINAYDALGADKAKKWMEDNLPLFKEVEKFNPVTHGVGLGQFGGINRMYYDLSRSMFINMVGPKYVTTADSLKASLALLPAFRDLNNLLLGVDFSGKKPTQIGGEIGNTLHTTAWELGNLFHSHTPFTPQTGLPYDVQQTNAWNKRTQLLTQYSKYIHDNENNGNWLWGPTIPAVAGEKITKQTVNNLIAHVYPAWDPMQGLVITAKDKRATAHERDVIETKAPNLLPDYDKFVKQADQVSGWLSNINYKTADLARDTQVMRNLAISLSLKDKTFYAFYKQFYQNKFGPLEAMH